MPNFKLESEQGYTLIQVLLLIIVISVLATLGIFTLNLFHDQSSLDEQALKEVKAAIRETQNRAKKEKHPYSISFQNNSGMVQYSIHEQGDKPHLWKSLNNYRVTFNRNLKINFNSQGNIETPGQKVVLNFNKGKKCLVLKEPLEKTENRQGAECN